MRLKINIFQERERNSSPIDIFNLHPPSGAYRKKRENMAPSILSPTTLPPSTTIWPCTTTPQKLTTIRSPFKIKCRATSSSSSSITDFDLYDLLGIDRSSNKSQIKAAYRTLQKRCHPDIAGVPGHDMAIILNEAYKLLSDPISRQAYDKVI